MADCITCSPSRAAAKRRKLIENKYEQSLLPGLPDHIAQICLSLISPTTLFSVCHSWRRLVYSTSFPPFLSLYTFLFSPSNSLHFSSFDPISSKWVSLPPPPPSNDHPLLLRHPSFISRNLPIQSISVAGKLVLLAGTTANFLPALPRPLIFDPISLSWTSGPPLETPRRWCAAGTSRAAVFVASGIGCHYNQQIARSLEKWDLEKIGSTRKWSWEKMKSLKDGRFSREAIDAVGWKGKLCMVNVKGDVAKEGAVYDVVRDEWSEMPDGMLAGWRGPAAAMAEETIYAVDESRGVLRKYDDGVDGWEEILASEGLRGAEHMAAAGGRVCVVCGGGVGIVVVDVVVSPPRSWVVDTPPGKQVLAIHVLPRMSQQPEL